MLTSVKWYLSILPSTFTKLSFMHFPWLNNWDFFLCYFHRLKSLWHSSFATYIVLMCLFFPSKSGLQILDSLDWDQPCAISDFSTGRSHFKPEKTIKYIMQLTYVLNYREISDLLAEARETFQTINVNYHLFHPSV